MMWRQLRWFSLLVLGLIALNQAGPFAAAQVQRSAGLAASYFAGTELAGPALVEQIDPQLDFRWREPDGPPSGVIAPLSVRWEGYLQPRYSEEYRFIITSDDGVRLWVNNQLLVADWTVHSAREAEGRLALEAGQRYPIMVEFFDRGRTGVLRLEWQSRSQAREVVPASALSHPLTDSSIAPLSSEGRRVIAPRQLDRRVELVNPLRGLYRWSEQEVAPQPRPAYDSYRRYEWRELEPRPGEYDFALLERDLTEAKRAGRKHGFRVRALVPREGVSVPAHLADAMERGWWSNDAYIPDWNDPDFMTAAEQLIAALGERYDGDPRVAFIDIGIYGSYGEWHMWPFVKQYPTSEGAQEISTSNARRIIDAYIAAFPTAQLVMMTDTEGALIYALQQSPRIGWRRDSLGVSHFVTGMDKLRQRPEDWQLLTERWKTAPVITEFISPDNVRAPKVYQRALEQARDFHIAMLGNGNTLAWRDLDGESQAAFLALGRALGYRYSLRALALPAELRAGERFDVVSRWANIGITPTYENWTVTLQLRPEHGSVPAWEGRLGLRLRDLLPTGAGAHEDRSALTLPSNLLPGRYNLHLAVRDPANYRGALALAIEGGRGDGSYYLGTVEVRAGD